MAGLGKKANHVPSNRAAAKLSPPANQMETTLQHTRTVRTRLTGYDLLNDRRLNKGTAFTEIERNMFSLHGLLPPHVGTLQEQVDRRMKALAHIQISFDKYRFMMDLQGQNETLFYALIAQDVEGTLSIIYTPAVGEGCQRFSEIWHKPRGLFLSYPNKDRIDQILSHPRFDPVMCIVVSDGERILGLGDQGAGGMGIPIGKTALYTALGGIAPEACLPVLLDVGTDNEERLRDPRYIGWCHHRIRGQEYDDFVDAFVTSVKRRWPGVLLQWEDFAGSNAVRLLARYRNELCTFNDDIQGTAAVVTSALLSAVHVGGIPIRQMQIAIVGFGAAGIGIANLLLSVMLDEGLSEQEARSHFWPIDRYGLLVKGCDDLRPDQAPFVRKCVDVAGWEAGNLDGITLFDVMRNAKPNVLIGVSAQAGAFTEDSVREMAKYTDRPVIFPLSNPTARSEASPQQLVEWTNGRALIGTGSPFEPVWFQDKLMHIDQTNNSYIFPGLALGIISSHATRVSDGMIKAAALELAKLSQAGTSPAVGQTIQLLPPIANILAVSKAVAIAVGKQAIMEGLATVHSADFEAELNANIWEPVYLPYELETAQTTDFI